MARILITGATGFLGGALVARLLEQDRIDEILLLVRASTTTEALSRISAESLISLATKPTLKYDRYHISAGIAGSNSVGEIDTAISQTPGVATAKQYRKVSFHQIAERQDEFPGLFGACDPRLLLRAIQLYGGFASLNILFDNRSSPCFADYIPACVLTSLNNSIVDQMRVDFK
jgi:Male sterility protein